MFAPKGHASISKLLEQERPQRRVNRNLRKHPSTDPIPEGDHIARLNTVIARRRSVEFLHGISMHGTRCNLFDWIRLAEPRGEQQCNPPRTCAPIFASVVASLRLLPSAPQRRQAGQSLPLTWPVEASQLVSRGLEAKGRMGEKVLAEANK